MQVEFASLFAELFGMTKKDVFVDLGGGYGTFVTAICKLVGCRGVGIEIHGDCVKRSKKLAKECGAPLAEFLHADLMSKPLVNDLTKGSSRVVFFGCESAIPNSCCKLLLHESCRAAV